MYAPNIIHDDTVLAYISSKPIPKTIIYYIFNTTEVGQQQ